MVKFPPSIRSSSTRSRPPGIPHLRATSILVLAAIFLIPLLTACGSHAAFLPPPIVLNVSLSSSTVNISNNGTPVLVPVTINAPTETASFLITGLPAGVSASYKESESNPSGLLTLIATSATKAGTSMPMITVGSSGQTASTTFTLIVSAANP